MDLLGRLTALAAVFLIYFSFGLWGLIAALVMVLLYHHHTGDLWREPPP